MHRTIEIASPPTVTAQLLERIATIEAAVGITVQYGSSVKPPGDVIVVHTLNRGADEVLEAVRAAKQESGKAISAATSELASLSDPEHQHAIDHDVDEAVWEELEADLRHQGRTTHNYFALMALGGAIAATGLLSEKIEHQVVAFIAAAIIAPGFEPVAKIALGLSLRRWEVFRTGLISTSLGYLTLAIAAALVFIGLRFGGAVSEEDFLKSPIVEELTHPSAISYVVSLCGAVAGVVIQSSFRQSVIAGALIAMRIIDAGALIGIALVLGEFEIAGSGARRLAVDVAFILASGLVVFLAKQHLIHRRSPLH